LPLNENSLTIDAEKIFASLFINHNPYATSQKPFEELELLEKLCKNKSLNFHPSAVCFYFLCSVFTSQSSSTSGLHYLQKNHHDDRLLHNREADDSTTAEDLESELASNAIGSTLYNKQWVLGN